MTGGDRRVSEGPTSPTCPRSLLDVARLHRGQAGGWWVLLSCIVTELQEPPRRAKRGTVPVPAGEVLVAPQVPVLAVLAERLPYLPLAHHALDRRATNLISNFLVLTGPPRRLTLTDEGRTP